MENNIKIETHPRFLPERSDPIKPYYFFSYRVRIINNFEKTVQLLSRYWHITDGEGRVEDIHGPGVVGQTPSIKSKQTFRHLQEDFEKRQEILTKNNEQLTCAWTEIGSLVMTKYFSRDYKLWR